MSTTNPLTLHVTNLLSQQRVFPGTFFGKWSRHAGECRKLLILSGYFECDSRGRPAFCQAGQLAVSLEIGRG